ncbi:hypothetical protein D7X75_38920, partial [Corallococcus sp. CA031C]
MRSPQSGPERRTDSDGVTRVTPSRESRGAGSWLIGGAALLTGLCALLCVWWLSRPVTVEERPEPVVEAAFKPAPSEPLPPRAPVR